MRIKIEQVVNVDIEKWAREYGIDADAESVRRDVRVYFKNCCQDQVEQLGLDEQRNNLLSADDVEYYSRMA